MSVLEQQSSTTQPIPNDNEQALEEDIGNKVEASGGKILDEGAVLPNVESSTEEVKVFEESDDNKCIPDLVWQTIIHLNQLIANSVMVTYYKLLSISWLIKTFDKNLLSFNPLLHVFVFLH